MFLTKIYSIIFISQETNQVTNNIQCLESSNVPLDLSTIYFACFSG